MNSGRILDLVLDSSTCCSLLQGLRVLKPPSNQYTPKPTMASFRLTALAACALAASSVSGFMIPSASPARRGFGYVAPSATTAATPACGVPAKASATGRQGNVLMR